MAHPAAKHLKRHGKHHFVDGAKAKGGRLDRKRPGAVDASSWRPPAERDFYADKAPDRGNDEPGRFASGGRLTAHERQRLPKGDFALPGKGEGPKGAGAGSYPIPDASHARNALARVSQHGSPSEKARVRAAVHRKFPNIGES